MTRGQQRGHCNASQTLPLTLPPPGNGRQRLTPPGGQRAGSAAASPFQGAHASRAPCAKRMWARVPRRKRRWLRRTWPLVTDARSCATSDRATPVAPATAIALARSMDALCYDRDRKTLIYGVSSTDIPTDWRIPQVRLVHAAARRRQSCTSSPIISKGRLDSYVADPSRRCEPRRWQRLTLRILTRDGHARLKSHAGRAESERLQGR
jgi:hypothetical protein